MFETRMIRYTERSTWQDGKSSRSEPKLTFGINVSSPGAKVLLKKIQMIKLDEEIFFGKIKIKYSPSNCCK